MGKEGRNVVQHTKSSQSGGVMAQSWIIFTEKWILDLKSSFVKYTTH